MLGWRERPTPPPLAVGRLAVAGWEWRRPRRRRRGHGARPGAQGGDGVGGGGRRIYSRPRVPTTAAAAARTSPRTGDGGRRATAAAAVVAAPPPLWAASPPRRWGCPSVVVVLFPLLPPPRACLQSSLLYRFLYAAGSFSAWRRGGWWLCFCLLFRRVRLPVVFSLCLTVWGGGSFFLLYPHLPMSFLLFFFLLPHVATARVVFFFSPRHAPIATATGTLPVRSGPQTRYFQSRANRPRFLEGARWMLARPDDLVRAAADPPSRPRRHQAGLVAAAASVPVGDRNL